MFRRLDKDGDGYLSYDEMSENLKAEKDKWDPPTLFRQQRAAVLEMARRHIRLFGGAGRAW